MYEIATKQFTPLLTAIIITALALTMIAPATASAQNNGRDGRVDRGVNQFSTERETRTSFGTSSNNFFAPWWFSGFGDRFGWLPPGLARLLERLDDRYGDDDDPDNGNPSLVDSGVTAEMTSADINLEFDEDVQARVFLSETSGFNKNDAGVTREVERNHMEEHTFTFEDLSPDTEYFFFVEYRDEDDNRVESDEMSFETKMEDDDTGDPGDSDGTNPVLEESNATTGTTTAEVNLTFNEPVQAELFVSPNEGFDRGDDDVMTFTERDLKEEHLFALENLNPNTEYFYQVKFRDETRNRVFSDEMSFTTKEEDTGDGGGDNGDTAPSLINNAATVGTTSATVDLSFDEDVQARLFVSNDENFGRGDDGVMTFTEQDRLSEHSFTLNDLATSTEYFYEVHFRDETGNAVDSNRFSFTTHEGESEEPEDTTGPVISGVSGEAGTTTVSGSWETDEPATSAIYTSTESGFALDQDGVIITEDSELKTSHALTVNGLATSTDYYHRIVSVDEAGNQSVSEEYNLGTQ